MTTAAATEVLMVAENRLAFARARERRDQADLFTAGHQVTLRSLVGKEESHRFFTEADALAQVFHRGDQLLVVHIILPSHLHR